MTWLDLPPDDLFGIDNLPYGVFSPSGGAPRVGVRVGEQVLDLAAALDDPVFARPSLNAFMAQGRTCWTQVRARVTELLSDSRHQRATAPHLRRLEDMRLHLPFEVADYVDFYASEHHATNLGRLFRPGGDPLTPNWKHLPIGYHGRAGTVVVSGTPVVRPRGQHKSPEAASPEFGPTRRLDIEAEVGFVVGTGSRQGEPVSVADFRERVFGVCLVNDWSARDLQAWEYVPLGPFLGKSFATSVSPWVVPLDALDAAWTSPPARDPEPLPYLADTGKQGLDLHLNVHLNGHLISSPPFASMYWTGAQMLAHMTVNGASTRTGDLYASGTVSGPHADECGSLIELTAAGADPLVLPDGSTRAFLQDGDEVTVSGTAPGAGGGRIGLGDVTGRIQPSGDKS
ncbi:fumarylacetoacetase [Streptomyces sp. NPDC058256]|uniref:fumarylacetoacetase n=1 Tax=Streptomyces sp. NPDC058256 TaxID=3346408 RepID=UPI0036EF2FFD